MRTYVKKISSIRGPMCFLETLYFAYLANFYWINVERHLRSIMQVCKKKFGKKSLNVTTVKLFSKYFFRRFWIFFYAFLCPTFDLKFTCIYLLVHWFVLHENCPKIRNNWKFTKEQEMFAQWTIDGVQHQFNKNCLGRQNIVFLRNT